MNDMESTYNIHETEEVVSYFDEGDYVYWGGVRISTYWIISTILDDDADPK